MTAKKADLPLDSDTRVSRKVFRDAIANVVWFSVGTVIIVLVGQKFRVAGLALACIETLFAMIQTLKVLFILVADIFLFFSGTREPDEADLRIASAFRMMELGVWIVCIVVLYKFFFP